MLKGFGLGIVQGCISLALEVLISLIDLISGIRNFRCICGVIAICLGI